MIVRDALPADVSAVHRLIGQLADALDEAAFRARFENVLATDGHREALMREGLGAKP